MNKEQEALKTAYMALADIINAADSGNPYSKEELTGDDSSFVDDCNKVYLALNEQSKEELGIL